MRLITLLAASAALLSVAPAKAADLSATAAALRDKALIDSTAWSVAESLTTEIGARPTGSPAMERARDWAAAKFAELGFTNIKVESYEAPSWLRGAESAEVVAPFPQKLHILGLGLSAPTPKGGLEAEIALFRTLEELKAQPPGALKGKIAVVTEKMIRAQDGSGYGAINAARTAGAAEASRRGAVAYLVRSLSTDDTRLPHTGGMRPWGDVTPIPAAALSTPDAELLEHMAERGRPVRVRLSMASSFTPKAPAWNISGEIRGSEAPDEVIVVGGHLDSWDPGTGAVDDAAGIAITTAAAKLIGELPHHPRRTIRVVMFGAEEQGGAGAAYAAAHKDELGRIVMVGESDEGAGAVWKVSLPKGSAGHPAMRAFASTLPAVKAYVEDAPARFGGADVFPMVAAGAPVADLHQDASRYFDLHHSADDTLDKIDPAELAQNVAVWAALLYTVADSDIDFRALAAGGGQ
ncbi:MAG: M20/M25/M40 family metallo-hydrolase [Phenylobacterium sp.]|uniref:M20/M25/M40 family metallo-hydrolase n=1 Tax=Phenylobacterium sp. TaxID=1871053 RepID=UPI00391A21C2